MINYILASAISAWFIAQVSKAFLHFLQTKKFDLERLFGPGGMPSAHSALVCAMVMALARKEGVRSSVFALGLVFAVVVMYDAMGVRRSAGEHAKLLNKMVADWWDNDHEFKNDEKLKEFVGHTPLEVLSGALVGVLVAILIPVY